MNNLPKERDFKKALSIAYRALARRPHSIQEIREKLKKKKVPESLGEKVLNRLVEKGFLNDREYAERFTAERHRRGQGKRRIKYELYRRGVSEDIITTAMETLTGESEEKRAYELALRKYELGKNYQQVMRFLLGRGFMPGTCRKAAAAVFTDKEDVSNID